MKSVKLDEDFMNYVLRTNDGLEKKGVFEDANSVVKFRYFIKDGKLLKHSIGTGSFKSDHFEKTEECQFEETRKFLLTYVGVPALYNMQEARS